MRDVAIPSSGIHPLSLKSLKIDVLNISDTVISSATGFIVVKDGIKYLVSNYHVFSGRNWFEEKSPLGSSKTPCKVRIYIHTSETPEDQQNMGFEPSTIVHVEDLYASGMEKFKYLTEEVEGSVEIVDVACLPLTNLTDFATISILNMNLLSRAHNDVLCCDAVKICGFPFGIAISDVFPIWKMGIISSEPSMGWRGLSCFVIDARTTSGMSGSPVYHVISRAYQASSSMKILGGPVVDNFVGIYSGRIQLPKEIKQKLSVSDQNIIGDSSVGLGLVWSREYIYKILDFFN